MIRHFFISPVDICSPRWQQAFPEAQLLHSIDELPSLSPADVVWLLLNKSEPSLLTTCTAKAARVVALTTQENPLEAQQALASGACGYLHYLATAAVLEQVSQVVQHNGLWIGADLMRQLVLGSARHLPPAPASTTVLQDLTPRERDVAESVAAGKTNKEVARDLAITERTVKAHLSAAFEKLGVRDRLHLVLVLSGQSPR